MIKTSIIAKDLEVGMIFLDRDKKKYQKAKIVKIEYYDRISIAENTGMIRLLLENGRVKRSKLHVFNAVYVKPSDAIKDNGWKHVTNENFGYRLKRYFENLAPYTNGSYICKHGYIIPKHSIYHLCSDNVRK